MRFRMLSWSQPAERDPCPNIKMRLAPSKLSVPDMGPPRRNPLPPKFPKKVKEMKIDD
jgi:hypothetical protein